MTKRIVSAFALIGCAAALASPVSPDQAVKAANAWIARNLPEDPSEVVSVSSVSVCSNASYYVGVRKNGKVAYISADTEMTPVLAIVSRECRDGEPGCPALRDMLRNDVSNMAAVVSAPAVLKASASGSPSSSSLRRKARNAWASLLGERVPLMAASGSQTPASSPDKYVLPGFEDGGKLTYWSQSSDSFATAYGLRERPLFNAYAFDVDSGGFATYGNGLDLHIESGPYVNDKGKTVWFSPFSFVPCGCVATAWAAAMQYCGMTGTVYKSTLHSITYPMYAERYAEEMDPPSYIDWTTESATRTVVPMKYDWNLLPSNYGGTGAAVVATCFIPDAARRVIAACAYNCGIGSHMQYGKNESAANLAQLGGSMSGDTSFAGFSDLGTATFTSSITNVIDGVVRSGYPVVTQVSGKSGSSDHAVLSVGRWSSTGMTRIFFGWGGASDGWYASDNIYGYTSIGNVVLFGGYDHRYTPAYGRVVCTNTDEAVAGCLVRISTNGALASVAFTDKDGYYRSVYQTPITSAQVFAVPAVSFTEGLSVVGRTVSSVRNVKATNATGMNAVMATMVGQADRGTIKLSSAELDTGVPGMDFVASSPYDAMAVARIADLPLVVAVGSPSLGEGVHTRAVVSARSGGRKFVSCYLTGYSGLVEGETFVLDPEGASRAGSGWNVRGPHVLSFGSYESERDMEDVVSEGLGKMPR